MTTVYRDKQEYIPIRVAVNIQKRTGKEWPVSNNNDVLKTILYPRTTDTVGVRQKEIKNQNGQ